MGGPKGMVFTFDTPSGKDQYCFLRAWNCSWISNFKEEDEVLFFGGYLRIKVHTLRLMETKENFQEFVAAIWYLDAMLTGAMHSIKSNKKIHFIIENLMNHNLNKPVSATFPAYIYEQFSCFALNKKQIILDLVCLSYGDAKMNNLILSSLKRRQYNKEKKREDTDVSNLIRSEFLSIFSNIQTLTIWAAYNTFSWSFSLIGLLSLISESDLSQIIIKAIRFNEDSPIWTQTLWNSEEESLKKMYSAKQFRISSSDNMGARQNEFG